MTKGLLSLGLTLGLLADLGADAGAPQLGIENASGGGVSGHGDYRRTLGDFDGDGRDDVLLRHEDGRWFFYPMNGRRHMAGQGTANLTRNLEWSVAGIGDFDGDGKDDVLLRKPTTGAWYYYPMNGRRHLSGNGAANLTRNLEWSVAGIGDFDGDGRDDVLLRHADGRWHYYPMDGRTVLPGSGPANLTRNLEWSAAGVGDFDGDGSDDVLLRKAATTGTWYYYPMNGRRSLAGRGEARLTSNLAWSVAGIGDFDGDGRDDMLLRHADGRWHYYPMDGGTVLPGAGPASLTGNSTVAVAGIGDLNGDGRDDVLVRRANGTWYYYPMDGRRSLSGRGEAGLTPNSSWGVLFRTGGSGAPTVATAIANRSLATGGDAALDLSDHFSDDQTLVYEVRSSDAEVLRVSVTGGVLTLMPVAEGSATVTVTARDPDGNEATQTFSVTVGSSAGLVETDPTFDITLRPLEYAPTGELPNANIQRAMEDARANWEDIIREGFPAQRNVMLPALWPSRGNVDQAFHTESHLVARIDDIYVGYYADPHLDDWVGTTFVWGHLMEDMSTGTARRPYAAVIRFSVSRMERLRHEWRVKLAMHEMGHAIFLNSPSRDANDHGGQWSRSDNAWIGVQGVVAYRNSGGTLANPPMENGVHWPWKFLAARTSGGDVMETRVNSHAELGAVTQGALRDFGYVVQDSTPAYQPAMFTLGVDPPRVLFQCEEHGDGFATFDVGR